MPIKEEDPWRVQYFAGIPCPAELIIPTEDGDAYRLFPQHRWIYNKMLVFETQGLECAPHGLPPDHFPVFSKPIYNMRGMGAGSRVLHSPEEYRAYQMPGHFWCTLLEGEHLSTDVAVAAGEPRWWRHAVGAPLEGGTFDHWTVLAEALPEIEGYCGDWICRNLAGYTGMVNLETLGGRIIEAHLRFADQWPDLYGRGWVEALVTLYEHGRWTFADDERRTGYSVVLFGPHGYRYRHPEQTSVAGILRQQAISSVQITFHEDRQPEAHSMPPGGFRLAIVNCWDLHAGEAARQILRAAYEGKRERQGTS